MRAGLFPVAKTLAWKIWMIFAQRALTAQYWYSRSLILGLSSFSRRLTVKISAVLLAVLVGLGASTLAQAQTTVSSEHNQTPAYRVNVVSRTTPAVNYGHRSGSTKIDFQGTDLMPSARGVATVESKRGATKIEAEFAASRSPQALAMNI